MAGPIYQIFFGRHDQLSYARSYAFYYGKANHRKRSVHFSDLLQQITIYEGRFLEQIFLAPSYRWDRVDTTTIDALSLRRQMSMDVLLYPIRVHLIDISDLQPVHIVYTDVRRRCLETYKTHCLVKKFLCQMGLPNELVHLITHGFLDFQRVHVTICPEKTNA